MTKHPQERARRVVGLVLFLTAFLVIGYHFSPGLPVLWGPSASAATRDAGAMLFEHEWTANDPLAHGDGLGPVFNATSCVACHFQGGVGGGGTNDHNVASFEVHPTKRDPELRTGIVHAFAVNPADQESTGLLHERFPIVKGSSRRVEEGHCSYTITIPDIDPVRTGTVNSTALFGAGWVDRISSKAITSNRWKHAVANIAREFQLDWKAIPPGRPRVLADGRIGKFGWKGQAATLDEFVAAACANELGLGNPLMPQATPLTRTVSLKSEPDLDKKQFRQLVAFVDTLPCPQQVLPEEPYARAAAERGKEVFMGVGCAICHTPDLGGVKGVYSDFLLHTVDGGDDPNGPPDGGYRDEPDDLPLPPDFPKPSEWKTPPLWGVADSAPYLHDGSASTLMMAVVRHRGDATIVTNAFKKLSKNDQDALIAFLHTLKAPTKDVRPASKTSTEQVALIGR